MKKTMNFAIFGALIAFAGSIFGMNGPQYDLLEAIQMNRESEAHAALAAGADVSQKNIAGQLPLHMAASMGYHHFFPLLFARGADAKQLDGAGCTALQRAAVEELEGTMKCLIEAGADPSVPVPTVTPQFYYPYIGRQRRLMPSRPQPVLPSCVMPAIERVFNSVVGKSRDSLEAYLSFFARDWVMRGREGNLPDGLVAEIAKSTLPPLVLGKVAEVIYRDNLPPTGGNGKHDVLDAVKRCEPHLRQAFDIPRGKKIICPRGKLVKSTLNTLPEDRQKSLINAYNHALMSSTLEAYYRGAVQQIRKELAEQEQVEQQQPEASSSSPGDKRKGKGPQEK